LASDLIKYSNNNNITIKKVLAYDIGGSEWK
jgi:hypothetical protein